MAYRVTQRIISSDDLLYPYFDDLCRKSKLLYNAALFVCGISLPVMTKNIGQRTKSKSSRSCVITTILSKHARPQSDLLYTP